jgi:peptidoglycan/LPS O-acetylase OafA/YrhL
MFVNHGYLTVDFFFMLSGYVMAHAYDDRWDRMTVTDFLKRRLIRLHPLIILGMTIGALLFFFQESSLFPKVAGTSIEQLLLIMFIGYTLIPVPPSMDIRGWNEMHPLNGPAWSLFFEYVANILHVFILRKLPNLLLGAIVFLAAAATVHLVTTNTSGDLIGGWSTEPEQLRIGFTRLLFPYMAGMLLRRVVSLKSGQNTFLLTAIMLIIVLSIPRVGGYDKVWINGLYESFIIILVFPLIIYLGAIGQVKDSLSEKVCTFLGRYFLPTVHHSFPLCVCLFCLGGQQQKNLHGGSTPCPAGDCRVSCHCPGGPETVRSASPESAGPTVFECGKTVVVQPQSYAEYAATLLADLPLCHQ